MAVKEWVTKTVKFNFENLEVWTKAIAFCDKVLDLVQNIETVRNHYRLFEQIESACASVAMNIAEGKGRYSKKNLFIFFISPEALYLKPLRFWSYSRIGNGSRKERSKLSKKMLLKSARC